MARKHRQPDPGLKARAGRESLDHLNPVPITVAAQAARSAAVKAQNSQPRIGPLVHVWRQLREFSAVGGDASYLWPRWLVLRAVGLVYVFIFAGIIAEGRALIGPAGIAPLAAYFAELRKILPGAVEAFFGSPSLFWLNGSAGMIAALSWIGLASAVALILNLAPRLALAVCWLVFLSFVTTWNSFSPAQLDGLMLEAALLCLPFAPPGLRPGLGASSPPRPLTVFMLRWLLFRVMFESALVKLVSADPHWRNLTAMDVLYETSPSPTILGYWVHQLPHAYHVFEIAFTVLAEFVAPLAAVFGGRRGRWCALLVWTALQVGIQLTCNFGWLNTAAFGLGLLLLDDRMLAAAADKLGLRALGQFLATGATSATPSNIPEPRPWTRYGLRAALALHFCLTLFQFARVCRLPVAELPSAITAPAKFFGEFRSANGYSLYANFETAHFQVDFEGSNDGGKTWRTYPYRHVPQRVDRAPPFTAPWFARFETTVEIQSSRLPAFSVIPLVASHLLAHSPDVIALFATDPFPDRAPTVVRMRRYRLALTDPATLRRTGHYWRKEFDVDYLPAMFVTPQGAIAQFDFTEADAALTAGNFPAALAIFELQYQLGNLDAGYRLADLHSRGVGVPVRPEQAFALFADLAERGEVRAQHNLGISYEHGLGVPADLAQAAHHYRRAAEHGRLLSIYALGALAATDRLVPKNDIEGLAFLLRAGAQATGADGADAFVREEQPALVKRLMERMSAGDIASARKLASERH